MKSFLVVFTLFFLLVSFSSQTKGIADFLKDKLNKLKKDLEYKVEDTKENAKEFGKDALKEFNERLVNAYNDAMKN